MILDQHARPLGTLRLSVTDRCNLRCLYCMPEDDYAWLPSESILDPGELERIARVFVSLGVTEIRLTGGEPLLRPELTDIVGRLAKIPGLQDLALTTNGVLFAHHAKALRAAGLGRVTFSVDTLDPERARKLSRTTRLGDVLAGLRAAREAGFTGTKINSVVMRGINDGELRDLVALGRREHAEVRFIEYMDVGGATRWRPGDVVSREEILAAFGDPSHVPEAHGRAPANRYQVRDAEGETTIGVIASTTAPFCEGCDRARVTADGILFGCLYAEAGVDLRGPLRAQATDADLARVVSGAWEARTDRGAESRRATESRQAFVPVSRLRADPHREMHTRGG
jgi:cyclic pyranopterin phosphate synthase